MPGLLVVLLIGQNHKESFYGMHVCENEML